MATPSASPAGSIARRIEDGYAAFNRGDLQAVLAVLSDDVEWYPVAEFPERQVFHGTAQVERHLRRLKDAWAELTFQPLEWVELPPHVVVRVRQHARGGGSGIEVEGERAHSWTVREDRVERFASYAGMDEALRETSAWT